MWRLIKYLIFLVFIFALVSLAYTLFFDLPVEQETITRPVEIGDGR